jgi:hypothetical protein
MNIMGIHITTKSRAVNDLLHQVDHTLNKNGLTPGNQHVPRTVQQMTAVNALNQMLKGKHFDVCCVRNLCDVCQGTIGRQRMAVYSSVHCVPWADMEADFRQVLVAMVLDDFRDILTYDHEQAMRPMDVDGNPL